MTPETFLKEFGAIAHAPGGVRRLREMILQLAVMGRLVKQRSVTLVSLIELGSWANGSGFPKRVQGHFDKPYLFCKVSDMNLPINEKFIKTTVNTIDDLIVKDIRAKIHQKGTVIFPKIGGAIATNKRRILIKPSAIDNNCIGMIPKEGVSTEWLYLVLQSIDMKKYQTGTSVPSLSQKKLETIKCAKPSSKEQERIVTKVDQLMALCDRLEAQQQERAALVKQARISALGELANAQGGKALQTSWKRLQDHLSMLFDHPDDVEDLKNCILQNAVMGKLVPQNPEDGPASELLKKIAVEKTAQFKRGEIKKQKPLPVVREDEKPFEILEGWTWCRLGTISLLITSGSRDWAKYYSDKGAKFLRMGNLSRNSFELRLDHIQHVTPPNNSEGNRTSLIANDLLISITGDVGMLGLISNNFGEAYINQHTAVMRFSKYLEHLFIPYFCLSPFAQDQFSAPQRGIKNSFRLTDVAEMLIPLPPIKEQLRIVNKIKELFDFCDLLKNQIKKSRTIAEQLAQSVVESITGQSTEKQEKMKAPPNWFPGSDWSKSPGQKSMRL